MLTTCAQHASRMTFGPFHMATRNRFGAFTCALKLVSKRIVFPIILFATQFHASRPPRSHKKPAIVSSILPSSSSFCKHACMRMRHLHPTIAKQINMITSSVAAHNGTCTRDPNMNLIIQYGLLGLVLGLGLGLGFILYCRIWRPLALPYMCPQPSQQPF